jgi:hypothetical protein
MCASGPQQAIGRALGISGPAGNKMTALSLDQQRNSCPYRPVGREAFRSAAEGSAFGFASRKMSLMLTIRYPKRPRTEFEKAE